jgi:hypothetical protein
MRTEAATYVFCAWAPGEAPPSDRSDGRGFGRWRMRTGGGPWGGRGFEILARSPSYFFTMSEACRNSSQFLLPLLLLLRQLFI